MALKTARNSNSVKAFLEGIENENKKKDAFDLLAIMTEETGCEAEMWGDSIIGFDSYHYQYESGREGDWLMSGFSPRKQNFSLYIMPGFSQYDDLLAKLGKHKTGKSCLYINKLADVDEKILRRLVKKSVQAMRKKYPK